jgi:hypothetical protein
LNLSDGTIEPEDYMYVSWAHVSNPDPGDKIQMFYANTQTPANGVFYASSCKEGVINPILAKGIGTCPIRVSTGTQPGSYQYRYIRAGQTTQAVAISTTFSVQTIAATNGDAQLFHLRSELEDPGVCGCVRGGSAIGYMGIEGDVWPLRSPEWIDAGINASLIGSANRFNHDIEGRHFGPSNGGPGFIGDGTLFFPSGWSEVGIVRRCGEYFQEQFCGFWPFESWGNLYNDSRLVFLDGTDERSYYPLSLEQPQHFKTYNVGGGSWTGEWCGQAPGGQCCPIWPKGPFCGPTQRLDWVFAPSTLADGFRHVFVGQEGQKAVQGIGWSKQERVKYCCNTWPTWDTWNCEPSPPRWGRRTFADVGEMQQGYVEQLLPCSGPSVFIEQSRNIWPQ